MSTVADAARPVGAPRPPSVTACAVSPSASAARTTRSGPARPARSSRPGRCGNSTRTPRRAYVVAAAPRASPPIARARTTSVRLDVQAPRGTAGPRPAPGHAQARLRQGGRLHAKNARLAIAEAKALPAEARRHLAEIAPPAEPAPSAAGRVAARRSITLVRRRVPAGRAAHVARIGRGGCEICDGCGINFDPYTIRPSQPVPWLRQELRRSRRPKPSGWGTARTPPSWRSSSSGWRSSSSSRRGDARAIRRSRVFEFEEGPRIRARLPGRDDPVVLPPLIRRDRR